VNGLLRKLMLWLVPILFGVLARHLATIFSGACPGDPGGFLCAHWGTIAGIGGAILAALGYGKKRQLDRVRMARRAAGEPVKPTVTERVVKVLKGEAKKPPFGDLPPAELVTEKKELEPDEFYNRGG
jgi:hypothetical protein